MIHWDTELAGFGLLVSVKTESKTFIAQRRLPDGRTRRVTVGAVGEFEKVEKAQSKAGRLLLELRETPEFPFPHCLETVKQIFERLETIE